MLTKLSSVISMVIVASAITVLTPTASSAATAPCSKVKRNGRVVTVCPRSTVRIPGYNRSDTGGTGGKTEVGPGCPTVGVTITCETGDPPAAQQVDPQAFAIQVKDSLTLPTLKIVTSPSPRSYIRIRTGFWLDTSNYSEPVASRTTPDGAVGIRAVATGQKVVWDLVEKEMTCDWPGSPGSTACGYEYQRASAGQPGQKYRISAAITWNVDWQCTLGCEESGTIPVTTPPSFLDLEVQEIQTESQP